MGGLFACLGVASCAPSLLAQDAARPAVERLRQRAVAFGVLAMRVDSALARANEEQARHQASMPVEELSAGRLRATVHGVPSQRAMLLLRSADSAWTNSWAAGIPSFPTGTLDLTSKTAGDGTRPLVAATISWTLPGDSSRHAGAADLRLAPKTREERAADARSLADLALLPWKSARPATRGLPSVATDTLRLAGSAYEELATSPFISGRACLGGSLEGCEQAMGLRRFIPPYDDVLDAAGRAAMLADGSSRSWPVPFQERQACIETMDDVLCRRAFAEVPPAEVAAWSASDARRLLVTRLIVDAAASGRLTPGAGPSAKTESDDLRLLAGDSLADHLRAVRTTIVAHRPSRVLPSAATSWIILVLAVVIAIAGIRTSRWRVA